MLRKEKMPNAEFMGSAQRFLTFSLKIRNYNSWTLRRGGWKGFAPGHVTLLPFVVPDAGKERREEKQSWSWKTLFSPLFSRKNKIETILKEQLFLSKTLVWEAGCKRVHFWNVAAVTKQPALLPAACPDLGEAEPTALDMAQHGLWGQNPPPQQVPQRAGPLEVVRMAKQLRHCTDRGWRSKEKRKIWHQPSICSRGALGLCGYTYKHNLMYITKANSKQNSQLTFTLCIGHTAVLCKIFYSPGI